MYSCALIYDDQGHEVDNEKCPFCRTPHPTSEEVIERLKKRVDLDDANAIFNIGVCYQDGLFEFPQDHTKALELFHRSAELGYTGSYTNIGYAYQHGQGVEVDKKKAVYHYEQAAIGGHEIARYNLGLVEKKAGHYERAMGHWVIAVRSGDNNSLNAIKDSYSNGHATKEDYTKALRLYQAYLGEIKSRQRDEAAAFNIEKYRYY